MGKIGVAAEACI